MSVLRSNPKAFGSMSSKMVIAEAASSGVIPRCVSSALRKLLKPSSVLPAGIDHARRVRHHVGDQPVAWCSSGSTGSGFAPSFDGDLDRIGHRGNRAPFFGDNIQSYLLAISRVKTSAGCSAAAMASIPCVPDALSAKLAIMVA